MEATPGEDVRVAAFAFYLLLPCVLGQSLTSVSYRILEELQPGSVIGNVKLDAEFEREYTENDLDRLRFSILSHDDDDVSFSERFAIDENSGILRLTQAIDREALCAFKAECLQTIDIAVSPAEFFRVLAVQLEILDLNDNTPRFVVDTFRMNLSESTEPGTTFNLPAASDPDGGDFGIKRYELIPDVTQFDVRWGRQASGATQVRLVLARSIDREETPELFFKVRAYDGGSPVSYADLQVTVSVTDINDNSPQFVLPAYQVRVSEDTPVPHQLIKMLAVDADIGVNAHVSYKLLPAPQPAHRGVFAIDPVSGQIRVVSALDREKTDVYFLMVQAHDSGKDARDVTATVTVSIDDVNDNAPIIKINVLTDSQRAEVDESAESGTFVALVSVSDKDQGPNGQVECRLESAEFSMETIHPNKYKIVSARPLDREYQGLYTLSVHCEDNGFPVLQSSQDLEVYVTDINDNVPVFSDSVVQAFVSENRPPQEYVTQVNATDADSGPHAQITYTILDGIYGTLRIDPLTGVIRTVSAFDFEQMQELSIHVEAKDGGDPPLSSTCLVIVSIVDVNDAAPTFSQDAYTFIIDENSELGSGVGRLKATDQDSKEFNRIEYSLYTDSGEESLAFAIERDSGRLVTTGALDRETLAVYRLRAIASDIGDNPLSGSTSVTIFLADDNDNAPTIVFPNPDNYTVQISSDVPPGFKVTDIIAHDLDSGDNAELRYFLQVSYEEDPDVVGVDPKTGQVFLNRPARELEDEVRALVIVKDLGSPGLVSFHNLTIVVNHSLAFWQRNNNAQSGGSDDTDATGSLVIIIAVVATSTVITVILLVAIAFVVVKSRRRRHQRQKFAQKIMISLDVENKPDTLEPKVYGDTALAPSGREPAQSAGGKEAPGDGHHTLPAHGDCLKAHICSFLPVDDSVHARPTRLHATHGGSNIAHRKKGSCALPDLGHPDVDAESSSSGEVSNTDSGRGASEEGEAHNDHDTSFPADIRTPAGRKGYLDSSSLALYGGNLSQPAATICNFTQPATITCNLTQPATITCNLTQPATVTCSRYSDARQPEVERNCSSDGPSQCYPKSCYPLNSYPAGPARDEGVAPYPQSYTAFRGRTTAPGGASSSGAPNKAAPCARQTVRDVKARDKSKRQDSLTTLLNSTDILNQYHSQLRTAPDSSAWGSPQQAGLNFHDASSLMNYKLKDEDGNVVCSSEVTDATSSTSGSYVIQVEDLSSDFPVEQMVM